MTLGGVRVERVSHWWYFTELSRKAHHALTRIRCDAVLEIDYAINLLISLNRRRVADQVRCAKWLQFRAILKRQRPNSS